MPAGRAGARDTLEVPYQVPTISREDTRCPICHLSFKTLYHLRQHMDVHRGEQFPCGNCDKMLVMRHMLRDHEKGCVGGTKYQCSQCDKEYSTKQGHCQHKRAKHGPDAPAQMRCLCAHTVASNTTLRSQCGSMSQHAVRIPTGKAHFTAGWKVVN